MNADSINYMKLRIKDHSAAVLSQAPSDNLLKVFSDSSPLTNKYDYSFTIPEIRIALRTSRSNTAPGSDGISTRVLQLCEFEEDVMNVLISHSILSNNDNDNTVPDKWKHSVIVSIPKRVIHHLLKTSVVLQMLRLCQTNKQASSCSHT